MSMSDAFVNALASDMFETGGVDMFLFVIGYACPGYHNPSNTNGHFI